MAWNVTRKYFYRSSTQLCLMRLETMRLWLQSVLKQLRDVVWHNTNLTYVF